MTQAYEPISLGSTCEAKFQICRKLNRAFYGKTSEAGFRVQMMPPERGHRAYGWHAFDWQRTPFRATLAALENDFAGMFEREDLRVEGELIMNRRFGTEHSHQFKTFHPGWTEEHLDGAYPATRARFDERAGQFREMLKKPGPYLYVWTASFYVGADFLPPAEDVRRLLKLLGSGSPDHRFHLLMVGSPGKDADYSGLEGQVSKALRIEESGKASPMAWEGNDAGWDAILEPFNLTLHDREPPVPRSPAGLAAPALEEAKAKPGLLGRLLGR
jgi:hypothetical protein